MNLNFEICKDRLTQNTVLLSKIGNEFKRKRPILVYCNFNKQAEVLSIFLKQNGKNAFSFHGTMTEV